MKKYRKKPVIIEAMKLKFNNINEVLQWMGGESVSSAGFRGNFVEPYILIKTLEGVMTADGGDYIIKGVKGEFYPCKADIFEMTYEEVI